MKREKNAKVTAKPRASRVKRAKTTNVRKATTRKSSSRSRSTPSQKFNKTWLDVPHHKSFFVNDGSILRNISELPKAVRGMHMETFMYHVNDEKHDFANWVEHVHGEQQLANELREFKSKSAVLRTLKNRI